MGINLGLGVDMGKLELIYSASTHVTRRPSVSGGSLITHLTSRKTILDEEISELDALIGMCQELLNEGY